ncbi:MAG: LPS translocon maturation chaperone LptM [Pseudomonadota bacterium]
MEFLRLPVLCVALALSGCGQTGALYFDEDPPSDQLPPSRKQSSVAPLPVEDPSVAAPPPVEAVPAEPEKQDRP